MGDPADWEPRMHAAEKRLEEHEHRVSELETDMREIRAYLGEAATKADIAGPRTYIDGAINGLLREALNATPARHAALWGGVAALATAGMLAVSLLH